MKDNRNKCEELKTQADNRQGQMELLEREIEDRKSEIRKLEQETREAKKEYKNTATQYGSSLAPVSLSRNISQNIIDNIGMSADKIGAPDSREVESLLVNYNNLRLSNERGISSLEREIRSINSDIRKIQKNKESLVQEMRSIGCYSR